MKPKQKSLTQVLLFRTVLISALLGALFGIVQVAFDYHMLQNSLQSSTERLISVTRRTASDISFNIDKDGAKFFVKGLLETPYIKRAELINESGFLLAKDDNPIQSSKITGWLTSLLTEEEQTFKVPLEYQSQKTILVGYFTIEVNWDYAMQPFYRRAVVTLGVGVLRALLLGLFIFHIINQLLTLPLRKLIDDVKEHQQPSEARNFRLNFPEEKHGIELAELATSINNYLQQNDNYLNEIEDYQRSLQEKIQLRTHELELAKQQAETANKTKSRFLTNMSHELRTPLNSILGFAQLMRRDQELPKHLYENLKTINRSGEHLLTLINNVLDLSKIEAGKITRDLSTFDLRKLISTIKQIFREQTDAQNLFLSVDVDRSVPRHVESDEGKLRQILINLVGNAVKFTENGGITIHVSIRGGIEEKGHGSAESTCLLFEVEDTGTGIAEDELDQVFQEFEQTTSGRSTGCGTGLGMPITKAYVNLLGGDISLESELGKGTVFRFTVEVRVASECELLEKKSIRRVRRLQKGDKGRYRILIADDVVKNRQLLKQLLESVGFLIHSAVNGKEAVNVFQQWNPHLILMDYKMPEMDGLEATRTIRTMPKGDRLPIISISASVFEEDRQIAFDAGANDFLPKPIQENELFASIKKLLPIDYVYDEDEIAVSTTDPAELTKESLKQLPKPLVEQLRQSIEIGDYNAFTHVLDGIDRNEDPTINALRSLADDYEHEKLLALLES